IAVIAVVENNHSYGQVVLARGCQLLQVPAKPAVTGQGNDARTSGPYRGTEGGRKAIAERTLVTRPDVGARTIHRVGHTRQIADLSEFVYEHTVVWQRGPQFAQVVGLRIDRVDL